CAVPYRGPYGATGFGFMLAVREAAGSAQLLDIGEGFLQTAVGFPELQLAESWRVDDECAAREAHELAVCGCVPPASVIANLSSTEMIFAEQTVDECRFANAR